MKIIKFTRYTFDVFGYTENRKECLLDKIGDRGYQSNLVLGQSSKACMMIPQAYKELIGLTRLIWVQRFTGLIVFSQHIIFVEIGNLGYQLT